MEILAEPGRFMVANAATLVTKIIGKAVRDGKTAMRGEYRSLFDRLVNLLQRIPSG